MKLKLFAGGTTDHLEQLVNDWLASNNVLVKHTTLAMGEVLSVANNRVPIVMISVWYE